MRGTNPRNKSGRFTKSKRIKIAWIALDRLGQAQEIYDIGELLNEHEETLITLGEALITQHKVNEGFEARLKKLENPKITWNWEEKSLWGKMTDDEKRETIKEMVNIIEKNKKLEGQIFKILVDVHTKLDIQDEDALIWGQRKLLALFHSQQLELLGKLRMKPKSIVLEEPRLYQVNPTLNDMGGYSSVPFYCSLCEMGEMQIRDNKLEDGNYHCRCSVWTSSCGGKWIRWLDKKKAEQLANEIFSEDNVYNQAVSEFNSKISQLEKETEKIRQETLNEKTK